VDSTLRPLGDDEGPRLDGALPPVVDAHVHLFPDRLFQAIWRWFERHAWPVRYPLSARAVLDFLFARGVAHVVALHYAHKPGIARAMNAFVADIARSDPRVTGLATVFPGEEGARAILEEAFALGLRGVKLHCHVQVFEPDAPPLDEIYQACARAGLPLVMHCGREPRSAAYRRPTHEICSAERTARVLANWPRLRLCVPHLGADEFEDYARLLERHENLFLDTTMMLAGYFPLPDPAPLLARRPERIMYGTDFPNLPYAWDREVRRIARLGLGEEALARVLGGTARAFFGIGGAAAPPASRP
jgi:predicted TIM-barrel fold metal-dependent hydrolase